MSILYQHVNSIALIDLLESYLPYSLPVYNCLLLVNHSFVILASFEPKTIVPEYFVVMVNMGHQLRIFCSLDGPESEKISERRIDEGGKLVFDCIHDFARHYSSKYRLSGVTQFKLGAINSYWLPFLRQESMVEFINWESCVLLAPISSSVELSHSIDLPDGVILRAGLPEDLNEIVRTLKVDHSPTYLLSRLPSSSLLLSGNKIIGHCITHLDGSIGTLEVDPNYRGKGYAKLVVKDRMKREERRSYSYVERSNLPSNGVFESLGFTEGFEVAWVGIKVE